MQSEWNLPVRFCGGLEREPGFTILLPNRQLLNDAGEPSILSLVTHGFVARYPVGFLKHGGRLYVDNNFFPEYTTPEAFDETALVCYDYATTRWIQAMLARPSLYLDLCSENERLMESNLGTHDAIERAARIRELEAAAQTLAIDDAIGLVVLNSCDSAQNVWGMQENYLIPHHQPCLTEQADPFYNLLASLIAARQAISESGGILLTGDGVWRLVCSQRAEFYTKVFWSDAGLKQSKPMIRIRGCEEKQLAYTLADEDHFTRIQVLSSNNSLPSSVWFKIMFLSLALPAVVEHFDKFKTLCLRDPLESARKISRHVLETDPVLELQDGTITLSEYLRRYQDLIADYYATKGSRHLKGRHGAVLPAMMEKLFEVISCFCERKFESLVGEVDYLTLDYYLKQYQKPGKRLEELRGREFFYHVVHPDFSGSSKFARESLGAILDTAIDESHIETLMETPYPHSRAYERGMIIKKFLPSENTPRQCLKIDWTHFSYHNGGEHYEIVRKNPWEGSKQEVGPLLERAESFAEYCRLLETQDHGARAAREGQGPLANDSALRPGSLQRQSDLPVVRDLAHALLPSC